MALMAEDCFVHVVAISEHVDWFLISRLCEYFRQGRQRHPLHVSPAVQYAQIGWWATTVLYRVHLVTR
jgi:hypothetical protein